MQKDEGFEDPAYEALLKRYGCSLCNEVFINTLSTNCHHKFCRRCILKWIHYCRKCPECMSIISKITPLKRIDAEIERVYQTFPPQYRKHREELKRKRFRAELEWKRMKIAQDVLSTSHLDRMKAAEGMRQKIKDSRTTSRKFRSSQHQQQQQEIPNHQPGDGLPAPTHINNIENSNNNNNNAPKNPGNRRTGSTKRKKSNSHGHHNNNNSNNINNNINSYCNPAKVEFLKLPPEDYGQQESSQISGTSSLVRNYPYSSSSNEDMNNKVSQGPPNAIDDDFRKPVVNVMEMQHQQVADPSKVVEKHFVGAYARRLSDGYDSPESSFATCSSPVLSIPDSPAQVIQKNFISPPAAPPPPQPTPPPPSYNVYHYNTSDNTNASDNYHKEINSPPENPGDVGNDSGGGGNRGPLTMPPQKFKTFSSLKEKERASLKRRLRNDNIDVEEFLRNYPVEKIWDNDLVSFLKVHLDASEDAENNIQGRMPVRERKRRAGPGPGPGNGPGSREKERESSQYHYQQTHQILKDKQAVDNYFQEIDRRRLLYDSLKSGTGTIGANFNYTNNNRNGTRHNNNNHNHSNNNGVNGNNFGSKVPPSKLKQMNLLTKLMNKVPEAHHEGKKGVHNNNIVNVNEGAVESSRKGNKRQTNVGNSYSKGRQTINSRHLRNAVPNDKITRGAKKNSNATKIQRSTAPIGSARSKYGNPTLNRSQAVKPENNNVVAHSDSSGTDLIIQKITAKLFQNTNVINPNAHPHPSPKVARGQFQHDDYDYPEEQSRKHVVERGRKTQPQKQQHPQETTDFDDIDDSDGGGTGQILSHRGRGGQSQPVQPVQERLKSVDSRDSLEELLAKFKSDREAAAAARSAGGGGNNVDNNNTSSNKNNDNKDHNRYSNYNHSHTGGGGGTTSAMAKVSKSKSAKNIHGSDNDTLRELNYRALLSKKNKESDEEGCPKCVRGPLGTLEGHSSSCSTTDRRKCRNFREFENGLLQHIRQKFPNTNNTNPRKSVSEIAAAIKALSATDSFPVLSTPLEPKVTIVGSHDNQDTLDEDDDDGDVGTGKKEHYFYNNNHSVTQGSHKNGNNNVGGKQHAKKKMGKVPPDSANVLSKRQFTKAPILQVNVNVASKRFSKAVEHNENNNNGHSDLHFGSKRFQNNQHQPKFGHNNNNSNNNNNNPHLNSTSSNPGAGGGTHRKYSKLINNNNTNESNRQQSHNLNHDGGGNEVKVPSARKSRKMHPPPSKNRRYNDDDDTKTAAKNGMLSLSGRNNRKNSALTKSIRTSSDSSIRNGESHKKRGTRDRGRDHDSNGERQENSSSSKREREKERDSRSKSRSNAESSKSKNSKQLNNYSTINNDAGADVHTNNIDIIEPSSLALQRFNNNIDTD